MTFLEISHYSNGGRGGIRTLGTSFPARSFSKRLVSASHPLFHSHIDIVDCIEYSIFLK
jgi:hypothetical protein